MTPPHPLDRPVWNALASRQMRFAVGNTRARRFDRDFGLFAAAADASPECLAALAALVFGSCRPLQTTDRRQPPLDLTLGELMQGLHLRRLGDEDLPLIEMHLLSLDMPSRNSRFHRGFGDAAVAAYVRGLDPSRDVLFGAIDPGTGCIVGLAEARPADAPKTMDLGASVLQSHRKHGLAHALVALAVGVASDQGATDADLRLAPGNLAANGIAARLGASFRAPGIAALKLRQTEPDAWGAVGVCDLGCHRGRRHNARTGLVRAIRVTRNLAGGANAATVTTRISTTGFGTGTHRSRA